MNFTNDELQLILDAVYCLDERNMNSEDLITLDSVKNKVRQVLNPMANEPSVVEESVDEA
jgi:hypothetical protein